MELPVGHDRPPSLREELQRYVRFELSKQAEASEFESFEEADDFQADDQAEDWSSQYELTELQEEEPLTSEADGQDGPPVSGEVSTHSLPPGVDNSQPAQGEPPETPVPEPAAQPTGDPGQ